MFAGKPSDKGLFRGQNAGIAEILGGYDVGLEFHLDLQESQYLALVGCPSSLSCDQMFTSKGRNSAPPPEPQSSIARNTYSSKPFAVTKSLLVCKLRYVAAGPGFWYVLSFINTMCAIVEARVIEDNARTSGISPFRLGADTYILV